MWTFQIESEGNVAQEAVVKGISLKQADWDALDKFAAQSGRSRSNAFGWILREWQRLKARENGASADARKDA